MSETDRYITLVIHNYELAVKLKEILEYHEIKVVLEKLEYAVDGDINPYRVKIPVGQLSLGLKIIESGDAVSAPLDVMKMTGMGGNLLIPVDFSSSSLLSVKFGFFLADRFGIEPIILHSYLAPLFAANSTSPSLDEDLPEITDTEDAEENMILRKHASLSLSKFKKEIISLQKKGEIPDIAFSTTLVEGVPEEAIQEYCKFNSPFMVVMSTRGRHKKESDLIGSVTAEVIDNCRIPVFAVPDTCVEENVNKIKRILMFCSLSRQDIITVRGLMRTFDYPACEVFMLPASEKKSEDIASKMKSLARYFRDLYPMAKFHALSLGSGSFDVSFQNIADKHNIQLLVVPNKKSNAFSRLFRPSLAHRCLFDRDIPMLAVPI